MIKQNGDWVKASWAEATDLVASKFKAAGKVAGLVSPRATVETLGVFKHMMADVLHSDQISLLYGAAPQDLGPKATLADIAGADCIVLVGGEPLDGQKVIGYKVKRAVDLGATLTIVADGPNMLDPWARKRVPMSELSEVATIVAAAVRPVVLYAAGLPGETSAFLRGLSEKVKYVPLVEGTNALGAAQAGIKTKPVAGDALFVLAADEVKDGHALPDARFIVAQAAYWTPTVEKADVVLPSLDWTEQQGHIINMEGLSLQVQPFLTPPAGTQPDVATLGALAAKLRIA
jgi:predicted molibdopterin-dependent oxidoreductase YjgC